MHRSSPRASGSLIAAHTVVSVGPYALMNRCPGAHRATSSPPSASPADTSVVTDARSPALSTPSTAGAKVACVTPGRATTPARPPPGSNSLASASTRHAPEHNAISTSHTAASNPADANCSTLLLPSGDSHSACAATRLAIPACDTATPFGCPVDPEV